MLKVDVVVPIYNSLDHVRECLSSLLKFRQKGVRLILIDDGSYSFVRVEIEKLIEGLPEIVFRSLPKNSGYLQAVNRGISLVKAPIVVLLNSDTIIFENFFSQIVSIFENYQEVGIVNPVSVWANWTRIPFPSGQSIFSLNQIIQKDFARQIVDIYNASGFCFVIRKALLDRFNGLDMHYDPGYWEETDLCMKVLEEGFRVVCSRGIFVYHHGWASFGEENRNESMLANERLFRQRWEEKYSKLEAWYQFNNPLREQINELQKMGIDKSNVCWAHERDESYSVLYILPEMRYYGGVISVIQIVNQLNLLGVRANIAVYGKVDPNIFRYGAGYFRPLEFESEADLILNCPKVNILVATHWSTVYPVVKMKESQKCDATVYFVQDFEPDFYTPDMEEHRLSMMTYRLISHRICKTSWLKQKLDRFPGHAEIIPLGLNTDVFSDYGYSRKPRIVSMARPSSERRNWPVTRRVFEIIQAKRPDLECAVYGHGYTKEDLLPNLFDYGLLPGAKAVAKMLNESSILLDCSIYQGFGRPGLEAMACGTNAILTKNGGITSYAKHMYNCLLVDPFDVPSIVDSILGIMDDEALAHKFKSNGQTTAQKYTLKAEGKHTKKFFSSIIKSNRLNESNSVESKELFTFASMA